MKNLKCILLVIFVSLAAKMQGDIILLDAHTANIGVRITNLDAFPDMTVIGYRDDVALSESEKAFIVGNNIYYEGHEKNPLTFYVVKSDYLKGKKFSNINLQKDKNVQKLNLSVIADASLLIDSTIILSNTAVELDYNLVCNKDNIYYLYNSKTTYKYTAYDDERIPGLKGARPAEIVQNRKDDVVDPLKPINVTMETIYDIIKKLKE